MHLPVLFRSRIYQGQFGSGQFQSIYQPFQTWWFQVFTTIEWMGLGAAFAVAALLGLWQTRATVETASGDGVTVLIVTAVALGIWIATGFGIWLAGRHAAASARWTGPRKWQGWALVSALHVAQPMARAWGRLKGLWKLRGQRLVHPTTQQLYGNLSQRDTWLRNLTEYLANCGWMARPNTDWEDADIFVEGPGPVRLSLTSVYEEDLERAQHFVRYRVVGQWKPEYLAYAAGFAVLAGLCLTRPYLLPLTIPWTLAVFRILSARRCQADALAQLAEEVAEPLGMIPVEPRAS